MAIIIDNTDAGILNISNPTVGEVTLGDDAPGTILPAGGTTGQVLTKLDNTDYNVDWVDSAGGSGTLDGLTDVTITAPANTEVLTYNGSEWVNLPASGGGGGSGRELLLADRTYYVSTTGSDSNDGLTVGSPFLTIQKALNTVATIDGNGFHVTIQLADGTYSGRQTVTSVVGIESLTLQGNVATPANVILTNTSDIIIAQQRPTNFIVKSLRVEGTGATCLYAAGPGSKLSVGAGVIFGAAGTHMQAAVGGFVNIIGSYTITGGAQFHMYVTSGGYFQSVSQPVTLTGTPAFSTSFLYFEMACVVTHFGAVFTGSATGKRYTGVLNGVTQTFGSGANYLPGNVAGTVATGAQYA